MEVHGAVAAVAEQYGALIEHRSANTSWRPQHDWEAEDTSGASGRPRHQRKDKRGQVAPNDTFLADAERETLEAAAQVADLLNRRAPDAASRGAELGRRQRPASAPILRRSRGGKEEPPQVNMNKVAPLGTAPRWSIRPRPFDAHLVDRSPGPGQYDLTAPDAYWCKKKPSYSMAKPSSRSSTNSGPGPGSYSVPSSLGRKGVTMGAHNKREQLVPRTPGPGSYDPLTGRSAMQKSIATRVAPPDSRGSYPGPGAYSMADQFDDFSRPAQPKHGFPISERQTDRPLIGPGPDAYEPAVEMQCRHQPVYSFGTKCQVKTDTSEPKFTTYSQFV